MLAALAALLPIGQAPEARAAPRATVVRLVIDAADPVLAGRGHAERVDHAVSSTGSLRAWVVAADELDTFLRVEETSGALLAEDDDGGGRPSPFVELAVQAGDRLTFHVAGASASAAGDCDLHLVALAPTEASTSARLALEAELDEVARLRAAGDDQAARALVASAIDVALEPARASSDPQLARALARAAATAEELGALASARAAREAVLQVDEATLPPDHADLARERAALAWVLMLQGDLARARPLAERAVEGAERSLPEADEDRQRTLTTLAGILLNQSDFQGARALQEQVVAFSADAFPPDHPAVLAARGNLAATLKQLGDLAGARALEESVLAARERTGAPDAEALQVVRLNLGATLSRLGELERARDLLRSVHDVWSRTKPEDHPHLTAVRISLGAALYRLGDLSGARALQERALETSERTLPAEHRNLVWARAELALTLCMQGELSRARDLQESVLASRSRALPPDHPDLDWARAGLADTLHRLGELERARAMQEEVLAIRVQRLPSDHVDVQHARHALASTLAQLGDLLTARRLQELVLEVRTRTLAEEHPDVQSARANLAATLYLSGDAAGARALQERVLAVLGRMFPEDHLDLQTARRNLALTLLAQGDPASARSLLARLHASAERRFPAGHPRVLQARVDLATTERILGDFAAARTALESALAALEASRGIDVEQRASARCSLAATLWGADGARARDLFRSVLEDPELGARGVTPALRWARNAYPAILRRVGAHEEAALALRAVLEETRAAVELASRSLAPREALARAAIAVEALRGLTWETLRADAPAAAEGLVGLCLDAIETARAAGLGAARIQRAESLDPVLADLRARSIRASARIVQLARSGVDGLALADGIRERDAAQRAIAERVRAGGPTGGARDEPIVARFLSRLDEREALIVYTLGYFRPRASSPATPEDPHPWTERVEVLRAFVVTRLGGVRAFDLGPLDPIRASIDRWRQALGASVPRGLGGVVASSAAADERAAGSEVRTLVLDPLRTALADARAIHVVLDDALHAIPFDALPEADARLGERARIHVQVALDDLSAAAPPDAAARIVVLGGIDYERLGDAGTVDAPSAEEPPGAVIAAAEAPARGTAGRVPWERAFEPLPDARDEAKAIASLADHVLEEGDEPVLLLGRSATRDALERFAPRARFLHAATHGWFAPESVVSTDDAALSEAEMAGVRAWSAEDRVRGLSPLVLCGLALAGANLPADAVGRLPGVITAEEIAALDLSGCELAVLSACDTNVGVRRAGQGVASLQMALHMAGARSVITSLWKVPDEATRELMVDFYRRMWVQKKGKAEALWGAKQRLATARDPEGRPRYRPRDWAGWVLTGDPN